MAPLLASLRTLLEDRIGLAKIRELAAHKRVPVHRHAVWYYTGGVTLFLFGVQVATGILLLLYYRPTSAEAFESVQFIVTRVAFGWLVRSVHSWSANLMVLSAWVHLFAVFFLKAYRRPRELTWATGFALLLVVMTFGFSGYLLPWNELAFFATRVGTDIPRAVPVVGEAMVQVLRGGADVTGATLTRFFGLHIAVLPAVITVLLGIHLALVQMHGMSVPPSVARAAASGRPPATVPFVPNFLLRELIGWLGALALLAALAAFAPWELGVKADPFAPAPAGIRPEWYFLWMFQTLKLLPAHVLGIEGEVLGVVGFGLGGLALFLVPLLDPDDARRGRSRLVSVLGALVLLFMVGMTIWAYAASATEAK